MILKGFFLIVAFLITPRFVNAAPFAYIGNFNVATVSVIDTATASVIDTLGVGVNPQGVWVSPDGSQVLITNLFDESVSVIDGTTNTVATTVTLPAGSEPEGVAIHPSGSFAYVVDRANDRVFVLDTINLTVGPNFAVGAGPERVNFHPNGTFAYVPNRTDGTVSVIDTGTHTVVDTITVGAQPSAIAIDPSGNPLYVGNLTDDNVSIIDTSSNTEIDAIPGIPEPQALVVHPSGNPLYATTSIGELKVLDVPSRTEITTLPLSTSLEGIDINFTGSLLYVVSNDSDAVFLVDTATNQEVDSITVGSAPHAIGKFIGPEAILTISPANLNFGNQNVGTISAPLVVTLTNSGNLGLNITSVTITGDFAFTDNCGPTVLPQETCSMEITFGPTAMGDLNGILEIISNATSSPDEVALTGTGIQGLNPLISGAGCSLGSLAGHCQEIISLGWLSVMGGAFLIRRRRK